MKIGLQKVIFVSGKAHLHLCKLEHCARVRLYKLLKKDLEQLFSWSWSIRIARDLRQLQDRVRKSPCSVGNVDCARPFQQPVNEITL